MMDRGWRRCGCYVYKYDLEQSCCQPYTIRLDITEFEISASQKKVLKKFNKFLEFGRHTDKEMKVEETK
jgi:arginine-tRNA-protein transferase